MSGAPDNVFTVIFFGGADVGITSMVERTPYDYTAEFEWGIGIEAYQEEVRVADKKIKLMMFEMGKERSFEVVSENVKRGTAGIVMVYDVTNRASLDEIEGIYKRLKDKLTDIPTLVVANKTDLMEKRMIGPGEGKRVASAMKGDYIETSVVDNKNIDAVFHRIASMILESRR